MAGSLLALHRELVVPAYVDYNNHLNDGYYMVIFSNATTTLMDHIGLGETQRLATKCSLFTLEMHVNYLQEVKGGTEVRIDTQILGFDAKRVHVFHTMHRGEEAEAAATNEQMLLHMDMTGPKAAPFQANVAAKLEAIWKTHKDLPRPKNAGRAINLPVKTS